MPSCDLLTRENTERGIFLAATKVTDRDLFAFRGRL